MTAPTPFTPGTDHVIVHGIKYLVTAHHPHGDAWRYVGTPVDGGPIIHFDHEDALPVRPIAPTARGLMARAGLDPAQFDNELSIIQDEERPLSPLEELLAAARDVVHYGPQHIDNLRGALTTFEEA